MAVIPTYIQSQINGLYGILNDFKSKLESKGVEVSETDSLTDLIDKIDTMQTATNLQVKSVTVTSTSPTILEIEPDDGYEGLESVSVDLTYIENQLQEILSNNTTPVETIQITENGTYDVCNYARAEVSINTTNNTSLNVTPITTEQSFNPSSPYTGYDSVTVAGVTAAIDENIVPENIIAGTTILGVIGNVTALNGETKTVTENGTYIPTNGHNGFTSFTVNVPNNNIQYLDEFHNSFYFVDSTTNYCFIYYKNISLVGDWTYDHTDPGSVRHYSNKVIQLPVTFISTTSDEIIPFYTISNIKWSNTNQNNSVIPYLKNDSLDKITLVAKGIDTYSPTQGTISIIVEGTIL